MRLAVRLLPLWVLPVILALACGGGATPDPTPTTEPPPTPATSTATPTPTATATAWWEDRVETPEPDGPPMSRVWNFRVERVSDAEVTVTFEYLLDLAPEANVFVHQGLLPDTLVALFDADGVAVGSVGGELDPTEFGDDEVGGEATFTIATTRFDDVVTGHVCIRVVTGNYQSFAGRTEVFCDPVQIEKVGD
jgi:hypothetical protein